ncbi:bifunctional DNA primase/polymerase [Lentilactobacillus raoultii]|uniref:Bifunctional DNA primase/polymerase n=1 Tax=Lentilactobacillus raoultii TaxID=1987503 RepID=A0ABW3PWE8_9LACO|nr:bifunctional DNA primase/polymerase [Lentilactobacillus raoultii]
MLDRYDPLQWALKLVKQGIPVFPLKANSKVPMTTHGYLDASTNQSTVRNWFNTGNANIGIRLDTVGLVVVDIDNHDSNDGKLTLFKWQQAGRPLTSKYVETTPHDGLHYFFKSKVVLKDKVLTDSVELKTKQIIVAPSVIDNRRYTPVKDNEIMSVDYLPDWLLTGCKPLKPPEFKNKPFEKTWTGTLLDEIVSGTNKGERNIYLTSLLGKILATRCDSQTAYELLMFANDHLTPALPERELNTIFKSILKRELSK